VNDGVRRPPDPEYIDSSHDYKRRDDGWARDKATSTAGAMLQDASGSTIWIVVCRFRYGRGREGHEDPMFVGAKVKCYLGHTSSVFFFFKSLNGCFAGGCAIRYIGSFRLKTRHCPQQIEDREAWSHETGIVGNWRKLLRTGAYSDRCASDPAADRALKK